MLILIYTTTPTKKEASKLAKLLLKKRLVACIQMHKIKSMYIWEEALCNNKEILLIMKTKKQYYKKIKKCLLKHHSYDTPQIYMHAVKKPHKAYMQWISGVTNNTL